MMDRKLASRYARALLSSLPDTQSSEKADRFLTVIRESLDESAEFRDLLYDPAVPRATRKPRSCRTLAERAEMPAQVANFMATIVDHNRDDLAGLDRRGLPRRVREAAAGIVPAEITTAWPLTESSKSAPCARSNR